MKTTAGRFQSKSCALVVVLSATLSTSGFDQNHRINSLILQGGTNSFAINNAFGRAFTGLARDQAQTSLDSSIADGSLSILLSFPGLLDLQGSNANTIAVGT